MPEESSQWVAPEKAPEPPATINAPPMQTDPGIVEQVVKESQPPTSRPFTSGESRPSRPAPDRRG